MKTTLTTNYDAQTNTSDVERNQKLSVQSFEGEANNKELGQEDTQRGNLNRKYLSLTLMLIILVLLFAFTVFNTCKVRFDIGKRSPSKCSWSV